MPRRSSYIAAVSLFLLTATLFTTASHGGDLPTLDQLIEATPNIDTSDPETKSFRFTVQSDMEPFCFETTIAWQRDKLVGMRMLMGPQRYPGWFISNRQTQLFDPCHGRMYKLPPNHPQFFLRIANGKFTNSYGIQEHSEEEAPEPIVLDLKSLLRESRDRAQVSQDNEDYFWLTVFPSKSERKGGLIAAFESQAPHKLHRAEFFSHESPSPFLRILDISYNEDTDLQWPEAPADELLSAAVKVVDLRNPKNINLTQVAEIYVAHSSVLLVQAALVDKEDRDHEIFLGVDWDKTQRFATEVGPGVSRLWR